MKWNIASAALAALLGFALWSAPANAARQAVTVWSGVYTTAQAERGRQAYQKHCSYCHHDDLLGGEELEVVPPALVAAAFEERFGEKSVGELFRVTAETMPWGSASRLAPDVYADIVSYLLKENGFPAGTQELPADLAKLNGVKITMKQ